MFKKGFAFSALLIGVFAFSSMAYNDYNRGPFQLGVKAGATWSGFWGSGISDFENSLKSSV